MLCIPQQYLKRIKDSIKSGAISLKNWNNLKTSQERRAFLEKIVGSENAEAVNTLLEKKMLLKNQERGLYEGVREILGLTAEQKKATSEKIKARIKERERRQYNPAENETLLNEIASDVYSKKYKTEVTLEEADIITRLNREIIKAREKFGENGLPKNAEDALDFGAKKVAYNKYIEELVKKSDASPFFNPFRQKGLLAKGEAMFDNFKGLVNEISKTARSLKSSLDDSFFGKQGVKVLLNPRYSKIWFKNFIKSFDDIISILIKGKRRGEEILDAEMVDTFSRENYLNGRYEKGTPLDVKIREEAYPTSNPSRLPVIGRFFKAAEVAYEAGAMRMRKDVVDLVYKLAEKKGVDLTNKIEVGSINELVNSMTGRGKLPLPPNVQNFLNQTFFSPKLLKSNVDYLILHPFGRIFGRRGFSTFATKMAAENLLAGVVTVGVMLKIAQALLPDDNKDAFNLTSSNFGKIKNGNMTIDLTGAAGGMLVAAAKILFQEETSATTGVTTKLGAGYGSRTGDIILTNFLENKLSPIGALINDIFVRGKTFQGKEVDTQHIVDSLVMPISIDNFLKSKGEDDGLRILSLIADGLGFSSNIYKPEVNWDEESSKVLKQFKDKVGSDNFDKANQDFNKTYNDWYRRAIGDKQFIALSPEDKKRLISDKKDEIRDEIFRKYNFRYIREKQNKLPNIK